MQMLSGNGTVSGNGKISISQTHDLTFQNDAHGSSSPAAGTYAYLENAQVPVHANPDSGYLFDHWTLDNIDVGNSNPYTVEMNTDHTLKCFFAIIPPKYTVVVYSNLPAYDSVWLNGEQYPGYGESVELEAGTYSLTGDVLFGTFDLWTIEGDLSVDDSYSATTTLTVLGSGTITLNASY
jgi:hypothetical protein